MNYESKRNCILNLEAKWKILRPLLIPGNLQEYASVMEEYRHYTQLWRQDMAFITTVQSAVLVAIGEKLAEMNLAHWLLSFVAFSVLLLGINSQRRLGAYLAGYKKRVSDIEETHNLKLMQYGEKGVRVRKWQVSNQKVFPIYYLVFLLVWIGIWIVNLILRILSLL